MRLFGWSRTLFPPASTFFRLKNNCSSFHNDNDVENTGMKVGTGGPGIFSEGGCGFWLGDGVGFFFFWGGGLCVKDEKTARTSRG